MENMRKIDAPGRIDLGTLLKRYFSKMSFHGVGQRETFNQYKTVGLGGEDCSEQEGSDVCSWREVWSTYQVK